MNAGIHWVFLSGESDYCCGYLKSFSLPLFPRGSGVLGGRYAWSSWSLASPRYFAISYYLGFRSDFFQKQDVVL